MARTGQVSAGPFTEVRFLETAADTNGAHLVMEHRIQPGNTSPPDHLHQHQVETFEVLAGQMWVRVRGEERTLEVGDTVTVPKGTPHTFKNAGDEPLYIRVSLEPANNAETFFETITGLERKGLLPGANINWSQLLQMSLLISNYDMLLAGVPLWVQRPVFGLLGIIARRSGYRAWYSDSSPFGEVPRMKGAKA